MKTFLEQDRQHGYVEPTDEPVGSITSDADNITYGDSFQGIEFLSDDIRMKDQALVIDQPELPRNDLDALEQIYYL